MSVQNYKYTILSPLVRRYNVLKLITALCYIPWLKLRELGQTIFCENHMHIIFVTPKTNSCLCAKKDFEPLLRAQLVSHQNMQTKSSFG